MIPENEMDRYRIISHTRYLFKLGYSKEYLVDNVRYNYGENCLFLPDALEEYDRLVVEQRRKEILVEITAATAQGIIDEMVANGTVELPESYTVKGTDTGRVIFDSRSPKCTINTPLNYFRVKLLRRFPKQI
jgi:hypothetical protein